MILIFFKCGVSKTLEIQKKCITLEIEIKKFKNKVMNIGDHKTRIKGTRLKKELVAWV